MVDLVPQRVAQGGMARVYICKVPPKYAIGKFRNAVAVKRLREWTSVGDLLPLIVREAQFWLLLGEHPNIVEVLQITWGMETPAIWMEFVPMSLRDRLRGSRPCPVADAVRAGVCVAAALEHAAAMLPGFIHGDIKPENILISGDVYKLSDFGLSRVVMEAHVEGGGTPLYMAPEAFEPGGSSSASDIYSLGCVLFEMLTGTPVFPFNHDRADYRRLHCGTMPPVHLLSAVAPPALAELIAATLTKDRRDRPSLSAFAAQLRGVAEQMGIGVPARVTPAQPDDGKLIETAQQFARLRQFDYAWPLVHELLDRNPAPQDGMGSPEGLVIGRVRALMCFVEVFAAQAQAGAVTRLREEAAELGETSRTPADVGRLVFDFGEPEDWGEARAALVECDRYFDVIGRSLQCSVLRYHAMIARVVDGDIEESLRLFSRCVELEPCAENVINLAMAHQAAGNNREAVELMRPVMETSTRQDFFAFTISQAMQAQMPEDVAYYADLAVVRHPTSGWTHGMRFQARVFLGVRPSDLETLLEDASWALNDPNTPAPISSYVKAWIHNTQEDAADDLDALVDRGYSEYQAGNLDSARDLYQQAVAAGDVEAMVFLGALEGEAGNTDLARSWFHRAIEQDNVEAMVNLGSLEEYLGNIGTAREWLRRAIEHDSVDGLFYLGELEQRAGNVDAARVHFARAATLGHEEAEAALRAQDA
jgi:tetratricopeptide (TPR) repeat protein